MNSRRSFLKKASAAFAASALSPILKASGHLAKHVTPMREGLVLSTWNHGIAANEAAWEVISSGGSAVDAAEKGVRITEADPDGRSVGIGGLPDRDGNVTLDACIMNSEGNAGAVCFLQDILHPVSVARKVMDDTPHVMLAGEGAKRFALENGFEATDLLTPESKKAWQEWFKSSEYKPVINIENHDTIGLLALDQAANLAGACTTSGVAYKMHGRVGDSPIIGAGLFVDNEVGAATATGLGELIMRTLGSFLIVELMRQGAKPQQAVKEAVARIVASNKDLKNTQVGYLAVDKEGNIGAYAIHPGFTYALHRNGKNRMAEARSHFG